MKAAVIAAALAFAGAAHAQSDHVVCTKLTVFADTIVSKRDEGYSYRQAMAGFYTAIVDSKMSDKHVEIIDISIELAYTSQHASLENIRRGIYRSCMQDKKAT
jgi:hypothetical protein